jgi:hypothetical protein
MRTFVCKHPILTAMTCAAAAFAAGAAFVGYYLSTWMILPLI